MARKSDDSKSAASSEYSSRSGSSRSGGSASRGFSSSRSGSSSPRGRRRSRSRSESRSWSRSRSGSRSMSRSRFGRAFSSMPRRIFLFRIHVVNSDYTYPFGNFILDRDQCHLAEGLGGGLGGEGQTHGPRDPTQCQGLADLFPGLQCEGAEEEAAEAFPATENLDEVEDGEVLATEAIVVLGEGR
mmetsp:Transcript_24965/g.98633  ORF Transcript_24965/g.98633 Transcript_24965/m.98633 type:complete len:186 (-) Transcript_24965:3776-4333(-)